MGDLCSDPSGNVLSILGSGDSSYKILQYFVSCNGTNPFVPYTEGIQTSLVHLNETFTTLQLQSEITMQCYSQCQGIWFNMQSQLNSINSQISCNDLSNDWNEVINESICTQGFAGMFDLWAVQFLVGAILYVVLCLAHSFYTRNPVFFDVDLETDLAHLVANRYAKDAFGPDAYNSYTYRPHNMAMPGNSVAAADVASVVMLGDELILDANIDDCPHSTPNGENRDLNSEFDYKAMDS